jgi:23S rRNA (adenine2503-C2)-methyltransferase
MQIGLAISLHQADDIARSRLMPVNDKYSIQELIEACRYVVEMAD